MKEGKWLKKPKLYIQKENSIIFETEPFTSIHEIDKKKAPEIVFTLKKNFVFKVKCDFYFQNIFDACGITIYAGDKRKAIVGTKCQDIEANSLQAIVYHDEYGDRSKRDIASNIHTMYYRLWHRGNTIRVQYSFNGKRYRDFREFVIEDKDEYMVGLYACSPVNSIFDCTFSELVVEE